MDWLDLLAVQGTLKSLLQHHSSKASNLQHSAFFKVQLLHPYMTTGKKPRLFNKCKSINVIHRVSQLKKKIIISVDAEKTFDKIQYSFMIKNKKQKNSPESRQKSIILQHSKVHIQQSHGKHYSQQWKTESISSKVRNKTRMPTLTTIIQHSFGSSSYSNQRRK